MEDDNGLDLTLSLPCGGPSAKGKNGSGSEVRVEEADRGSKLIDDFKNFLDGSNHKEESNVGSQRSNQSKPEENLFYDLSKGTANVDSSSNINSGGFWGKNDGRSTEILEDRRQEAGSKRKNMFDEINHQKRQEREAYLSGLHVKARTPHVSITTDEGSTAENEDVADSEADASTSKLVQHRDDASKRHTGSVGLSEGAKEVRGVSDSSGVDLQAQRRFTISSEKEFKVGHVPHGVPFSGQSANILNMPYPLSVKESNSNPVPTVEAGKSEGLVSHSSQYHPSYFGRGPPNSNRQNDGVKITQATTPVNGPNPFERAKGDDKHAKEEGTSMHTEVDTKGTNGIDQARVEGLPSEYPAIRPGIAAELKFGGSGSSPNLPWVSTTGPGPNGKTISGVTYRYSGTQIRIVCACHGSHMSPEEFVQHASEEQPNPNGGGGGSGLPSFPNSNPAASAQN
ncbi:ninja-family protein mc410 isoform X4 [Cynara cardunculus var. scolymus]|uniref:ninja-family protein mc410 isoform X4 n=1 Tax=Cynara cardunculus var. scolymus TaxID=59895 RepID=UPI000D627A3D|nr:ninja-family protein mc410 isoform X4 [Cynara cardunculus var. scolymus]